MHHREKRYRSFTKALVYRLLSICIDYTVAYFITQDFEKSTAIVILSNTVSLIVYFAHERAWDRISWGKHSYTAEIIIKEEPKASVKK
jgi:uncharacterized membrane protein